MEAVSAPYQVAQDTWLIPRMVRRDREWFTYINSLVIRGQQPVIVDTGASVYQEQWCEDVFSLVEPIDVRYLFISHEHADHVGNLPVLLDMCPNATVLTDMLGMSKLAVILGLRSDRCRWLGPGDTLDLGDRTVRAVRPPLFDTASTRGLFDHSTGVLWAVDSFTTWTSAAVLEAADLPQKPWAEALAASTSLENPWHAWLDPAAFAVHVDSVARLNPSAVACCHGPILRGERVAQAFAITQALAGKPALAAAGAPAPLPNP